MLALNAEDSIVAGQVDLDHDVFVRHLFQQIVGTVLVHHVHAMADAPRMAQFDGLADMEAKAAGRHQARRKLPRMKADVYLWVDAVQIVEHPHLQVVVLHGPIAVLRHHEVDTDHARIRHRRLEAEQRLREHLLRRKAAQDLKEVTNGYMARRSGVGLAAMLHAFAVPLLGGEVLANGRHVVLQTLCQQGRAHLFEVRLPPDLVGDPGCVREVRRLHDFKVLLILRSGARCDLVQPFSVVHVFKNVEPCEGREELVMSAEACERHEAAHGEAVDQIVIQLLIGQRGGGGDGSRRACRKLRSSPSQAGWLDEAHGRGGDAKLVLCAVCDEGLRVDGAAQVHMQVGSLGHVHQESMQVERVRARGVEGADGAVFRRRT